MSDETRGWDAINVQLKALYGTQEPQHWAPIVRGRLGGPDPLDGVSAYDAGDHWHYVTYGLTELYEKSSDTPEVSGWSFELTFRLAKGSMTKAPAWPVAMFNNLARFVFGNAHVFQPGQHADLSGPLSPDEPTQLTAALFVKDPQLASVENGPFGRFDFVQLVGVHADEYAAAESWNTNGILDGLRANNALLVTELSRASLMRDAAFVEVVAAGIKKDGTSVNMRQVEQLAVEQSGLFSKKLRITLGVVDVEPTKGLLRGRLPFGNDLTLIGRNTAVRFEPGKTGVDRSPRGGWIITVDEQTSAALLDALVPRRGRYRVAGLDAVEFEVVE